MMILFCPVSNNDIVSVCSVKAYLFSESRITVVDAIDFLYIIREEACAHLHYSLGLILVKFNLSCP